MSQFVSYPVEEIIGQCHVLYIRDYVRGKPAGADAKDVYVCESRYNEATKTSSKIKNWQSCLPESVRNDNVELQLYAEPLQLVRTPLEGENDPQVVKRRREETLESDQKKRSQQNSPVIGRSAAPSVLAINLDETNIPGTQTSHETNIDKKPSRSF
jgi:hypothetical protein